MTEKEMCREMKRLSSDFKSLMREQDLLTSRYERFNKKLNQLTVNINEFTKTHELEVAAGIAGKELLEEFENVNASFNEFLK